MDIKTQERENLRNIITQWNANRLDLFEISEPNEDLEFHGVMRFYFQDAGQKVATKCIRVSNTATTRDVIQILIEKFRPDIRMLSVPEYALYEIHENGDERKLAAEETPLLVQLNWHRDDREGRFLLRRMDEKTYLPGFAADGMNFKRKLSKREKKELKKREKKEKLKGIENNEKGKNSLAEKLYTELPETSFTRSISNPEAVMRRRRAQKLGKKLQQFSQEGGSESGGTLRIFGESINKDVPYKTLLLSTRDTSAHTVKEILDKYGRDKEDPSSYCLVQLIVPVTNGDINSANDLQNTSGFREYILDDDDCPLAIEKGHNKSRGVLTFHIRRRPADYQPRKRKKKPKQIKGEIDAGYTKYDEVLERLPYLYETNPDGSEVTRGDPKKHYLYLNVTEVGSERSNNTNLGQSLQLFGPNIQTRHCVIAHTEGIVTVTPSSRDAETYVDGNRIYETTILQNGMLVRFGKLLTFRYIDPIDKRRRLSPELVRGPAHSSLRKVTDELQFMGPHSRGSYETTFDADGNIETTSIASKDERMSKKSDDTNTMNNSRQIIQMPNNNANIRKGNDPILPAILELWEDGEDVILNTIITCIDPNQVQFKLAVTYTVYMGARYRASTHFKPEITPNERAHRLTGFTNKVANMIHQIIEDNYRDSPSLAFWLANSSELLHFLKQDRHLSAYTFDAQDILAEGVQLAFRSLVMCQQLELQNTLLVFLDDRDDIGDDITGSTSKLLNVLSSAMTLLRRCRVNAALTIQLFSQLFHFINMWLFNRVVGFNESAINYCTHQWGVRLKARLSQIEVWAEKQGLELAADCHLSRIVQASNLLQSPKNNPEDIATITSSCFKLNSLQLRALFERYQSSMGEAPIPRELIQSVIKVAENTSDELARNDGREIRLEEEPDLNLPFLLPEDGYSCDVVRGVPGGLQEFINPLIQLGLCHLTIQPSSSGFWTIYMNGMNETNGKFGPHAPPQPSQHNLQSIPMPIHCILNESQQSMPMGQPPSEPSTEPSTPTAVTAPLSMGSLIMPSAHPSVNNVSGRASTLPLPGEPEIHVIKLQKSNNGMGLSIVATRGVNQNRLGIYIKSVVKGGAADQDGRLTAGDQLLKVDGHSLIGISQERAAELMTQTGPIVTLEVAKQGAIYHGLAGILTQPSPSIQRGYGNSRRLSERDIPSKINYEHEMQMRAPRNGVSSQMHGPRIQGSKSVPTLNNADQNVNSGNGGQMAPPPPQRRVDSVQQYGNGPPGYTSAAIPKSYSDYDNAQHSKGSDNGNNNYRGYVTQMQPPPPPASGLSVANNYSPPRPESQMSLQSQQANRISSTASQSSYQEERHYQNIQMYQIQQNSQNPPKPSPNSMPPQHRLHHSSHSSLHYPDAQYNSHAGRPLSALISTREHDQYINANMYPPNTPTTTRPPPPLPHHPNYPFGSEQYHNQTQYSNSQIAYPKHIDYHRQNEIQQPLDYPNSRNYPPPHPPYIDPRQRDLMRQEAKMEEMRDELRRREERVHHVPNMGPNMRPNSNAQWQQRPQQQYPVQQGYPQGMNGTLMRMAPPPAPKPRPQGPPYDQSAPAPYVRQASLRDQDMVLQTNTPPPAVSYRYGPSGYPPSRTGDPIKPPSSGSGAQRPPSSNAVTSRVSANNIRNNSGVISPSPWEREEREKARQKKAEDSKHSRDEEIRYLETLPYRGSRQEERLRTLSLEREFQRRAEEMHGEDDEDDDEEVLERADHRERMLTMHQELERTRQRRMEREQLMQQNHQTRPNVEEWAKKSQNNHVPTPLEEQEERLKTLRLEEIKRHKELEATQLLEDRLIREARRRQEDDPRLSRGFQQPLGQGSRIPYFNNQNSTNDVPPPLPKSPPPLEAPQRLDRLLLTTASTYGQNDTQMGERKVTFDTGTSKLLPMRNGENDPIEVSQTNLGQQQQHTPKKVSWNDTPVSPVLESTNHESDISNGSNSFTLQDIDEVLGTAPGVNNTWLSNSYVSGNTPGVIGAQEVYNDPRHRIEAEKLKLSQNSRPNHVGPEKLSFKEKMKMFAMETGQNDTPRDKVKISKAQREIEINFDGTPNTILEGHNQSAPSS